MNLLDFRRQYPQYDDISDAELAESLYKRFYSDIPREEFLSKVLPPKVEQQQEYAAPQMPEEQMAVSEVARGRAEIPTVRPVRPEPVAPEYQPATPEEQMATSQVSIGLAEAKRPSVTEALPIGAPVSERPLQMPTRPFQPRMDMTDALVLGELADRAKDLQLPEPTRPGPTIEAAKELERQRILDLAIQNVDSIALARDASKRLFDEYPDLGAEKEQKPLTYAALASGARFIANMGDALRMAADAGQRNLIEPDLFDMAKPQVVREIQNLAYRLFPKDDAAGKAQRLDFAEKFSKKAEELSPSILRVDFDDAWSGDRAGAWLAAKLANSSDSATLFAATLIAPQIAPVTLPIIGLSSAGGTYAEDIEKGVSQQRAAINALVAGVSEPAFEAADVFIFKGAGKAVGSILGKLSAAERDALAASLAGRALKGMAVTAAASAGSGVSEALTSLTQDLSTKYIAGRDPGNILKNAKESLIVGAAMGPLFTAVGAAPSAIGRIEEIGAERAAEQARTAALQRWQTEGFIQPTAPAATIPTQAPIAPPAPAALVRTMEQVRDEIQSAQDLDTAIATSEQAVSEVPTRAQITAAAAPAAVPAVEQPRAELTEEQILSQIQGVVVGEPVAPAAAPKTAAIAEAAPAAPRIEVPPTGRVEAPRVEAAPRIEVPPTGRVEVAAPAIEAPPTGRVEEVPVAPQAITTEAVAPAAPAFTDLAAKKADKARGIVKGEVLTFTAEKQAAAYVKSNKIRGYSPRQTDEGWVLSKPVRERTPAQIAATQQRMQVRPDDDLLTALAKMGGLNAENIRREGADKEDLKTVNKSYVLKPFRKTGGMSVDGAAEVMAEMGYDVFDEDGRIDANKAWEIISETVKGDKVYSPEGYEILASRSAEERAQMEAEKEAEAIAITEAMPAMAEDELLAAAALPREETMETEILRAREPAVEMPPGAEPMFEAAPGEFVVATPIVQQENIDQAFAQAETQVRQGSTAQYENAEPTYEPTGPSDQPAARVSEPTAEYAVRRRGGLVQLRAGGFYQTLGEQGHLGLIGQKVDSPARLAELAQIYRNPGYETFRVFFTDQDGRIVEQTGVSARLPGQAGFLASDAGTTIFGDWVQSRMDKNGAEGFYILHNHPSGDPTPSTQDTLATREIATNGFLGHIVIDSNRYAKIDANGEYELLPLQKFSTQDPVRRQLMQNGVIGTPIAADADVAKIGRLFATSEDMSVVIAQGNGAVNAIGEIPNQTLLDPQRGPAAIRRFARFNGGAQMFIYTQDANRTNPNVVRLYDQGFVTDVVSGNGNSIVAERGFSPNQGTFGGTRTRTVQQLGEERAIQEPSAAEVPVREGARGGEAVGERDAQREEVAREGRPREEGAKEVAQPELPYSAQLSRWFSELERQVSQGPESMPAAQWKGWLANRKSIKPDEIFWTGINDFLDLQTGKVSKQQIQDFLKENGVRVAETELDTVDAPFQQYTLPGGENYRVVLLTLPVEKVSLFSIKPDGNIYRVYDSAGELVQSFRTYEEADRYRKYRGGDGVPFGPKTYRSPHFGQLNIIVHIRVNDRTDADGKRVLFVEEIQSDWGQEGKKKGFQEKIISPGPAEKAYLEYESGLKTRYEAMLREDMGAEIKDPARLDRSVKKFMDNTSVGGMALALEEKSEFNKYLNARDEELRKTAERIPVAPFVAARQYVVYKDGKELVTKNKEGKDVRHRYDRAETAQAAAEEFGGEVRDMGLQASTEGWLNLALKKVMIMAAEGGYDRVAFINGQQSADRYDLSKQVDRIEYENRGDNAYILALDNDEKSVINQLIPHQQLENYVGKEIAEKIINGGKEGRLTDADLKVGGEGMKAFYDQIVPAAVKKLLPKVGGGQMATVDVSVEKPITQAEVDAAERRRDFDEAERLTRIMERQQLGRGTDEAGAKTTIQQPGFDVTPEMREFISGGLAVFEPASPYVAGSNSVAYNVNDPTRADAIIRTMQDRAIDLKRVIDNVRKAGVAVKEAFNPYLQEGLYASRVAAKDDLFRDTEWLPLLRDIGKRNLTREEVEQYLHARHAPSRNREMAKRNPTRAELNAKIQEIRDAIRNATPGSREAESLNRELRAWESIEPFRGTEEERNSLSGMSTQTATDYMNNLSPEKKANLEAIAAKVDAIIAKTRKMLIDGGVDSASSFNDNFEYYVPLYREGHEEAGGGYGQGFSVRGKTTKAATGSMRGVVDILASIAAARALAVTRVEKNRIANAMLGLALTAKDPSLWQVDVVPKVPTLDKATGKVVMRGNPNYGNRDNVIVARLPDGKGGIVERAVVFNENNERAMLIARFMKNLDADTLGGFEARLAAVTRFIASMNTQYNPIFGVVNLLRDIQGAAVNLSDTPLAGKQVELVKTSTKMFAEIALELRAQRRGETRDTEYSRLFEEFKAEGGQTGFRSTWGTREEATREIEKAIKRVGAKGAAGAFYKTTDALASVTKHALSDWNQTLENTIRLAAYKMAKDSGMSKAESAMLAKDITVNFNRKGTISTKAGAYYAFFNASVQGTARLGRVLDVKFNEKGYPTIGPRGMKIIAGGVSIGMLQAFMLAAAGFDEDEPPEFVKEKNFVIPLAFFDKFIDVNKLGLDAQTIKNKYITIPMPLGLNILPNLGRLSTELVLNDFKDPGKKAADMIRVTIDSFNPLGSSTLAQTIAPTTLDPFVALYENRDWTGKPIYRESLDKFESKPGFERAKDNASFFGLMVAKGLNRLSGGTDYTSGVFPSVLSPTPDQIDYLVGQALGGVGRELTKFQKTISAQVTGEELPPYQIPLVSRFYGEVRNKAAEGQKFYENVKVLLKHQREVEGMAEEIRRREEAGADAEKIRDDLDAYIEKNPQYELAPAARSIMRDVQKIRANKREAIKQGAERDEIKEFEDAVTERMMEFNAIVKEFGK